MKLVTEWWGVRVRFYPEDREDLELLHKLRDSITTTTFYEQGSVEMCIESDEKEDTVVFLEVCR